MDSLKLLILIDKHKVDNWVAYFINKAKTISNVEIFVCNISKPDSKRSGIFYPFNFFKVIFDFVLKIDRYYFEKKQGKQKFVQISGDVALSEVAVEDLGDFVKSNSIELIINLGPDQVFLNVKPLFGIWKYKVSKLKDKFSYLNGFWELFSKQGEIFGEIIVKTNDKVFSLSKTFSFTHKYSITKTLNNHLNKASEHLFTELKKFVSNENCYCCQYEPDSALEMSSIDLFYSIIRLLISYVEIIFKSALKKNTKNKWYVLYKRIENGENIFDLDLNKFVKVNNKVNVDRADPFGVQHQNSVYVYYEETGINNEKGHLACSELDVNANCFTQSKVILDKNYHLSYPNIIEYKNSFYMIPESGANNQIALYKCDKFPYSWSLVKVLMDNVSAADTDVFYYNGLWWMFTTIKHNDMIYNYDDLHIFYAKDLFSEWVQHPLNPVVSDVKNGRGAGKIVNIDSKLYRPSQYCRYRYGYGLNINEIIKLSPFEYEETVIKTYFPNEGGLNNIHTINFVGEYIFIDAK